MKTELSFWLVLAFCGLGFLNAAENPSFKEAASGVELLDVRGAPVELKEGRPTLFVLWSMRCPCAKKYSKRLNQIYKDFGEKGLQMMAVDPFAEETVQEIAEQSSKWGIKFPVVKDRGGKLAKKFELKATPEVFLFDQNGKVAYSGAIDDARYFMKKPKANYLLDALGSVFRGEKPAVPFNEPWGCSYYRS